MGAGGEMAKHPDIQRSKLLSEALTRTGAALQETLDDFAAKLLKDATSSKVFNQTSPVCTCPGAGHNPKTCGQTKWVAQDILIAEEEERVERNQNGKGREASMWKQVGGIEMY